LRWKSPPFGVSCTIRCCHSASRAINGSLIARPASGLS
jgi:hypothetical protein